MTWVRTGSIDAAKQQWLNDAPLAVLQRYVEIVCIILALLQAMVLDTFGNNTILPFGGSHIQASDLALPLMPLVVALSIARRVRPPAIVLLYYAFYSISFARGLQGEPANLTTQLRFDILFLALLWTFSTSGLERVGYETIRRLFLGASAIMLLVGMSRLVYGPNFLVHMNALDVETADDWNDGRILSASTAIIFAISFLMEVTRDIARPGRRPGPLLRLRLTPIACILLFAILISGQRTATMGLLLAIGFMLINRARQLTWIPLFLLPVVVFLIIANIINIDPTTAEDIGEAVGGGRSGTFQYRVLMWKALFLDLPLWSGFDLLFGQPLGTLRTLYLPGRLWNASLHSAYIGLLPLIGFLGTFTFVGGVFFYLVRTIAHFIRYAWYSTLACVELRLYSLLVVMVFGISYEWRTVAGMLLGIAFNAIAAPQKRV